MEATSTTVASAEEKHVPASRDEALGQCCRCRAAVDGSGVGMRRESRMLRCMHVMCIDCLKQTAVNGPNSLVFKCPVCELESQREELVENFILPYLQATAPPARVPKCGSCDEGSVAHSRCLECNDALCDRCVEAHQRVKLTKDHRIHRSASSLESQAHPHIPSTKCKTHPREELVLYCATCGCLTCRDCQLTQHRQHEHHFLKNYADAQKADFRNLLGRARETLTNLKASRNLADKRVSEVNQQEMRMRNDLRMVILKIQKAMTQRGTQILNDIQSASQTKKELYLAKKAEVQRKLASLQQIQLIVDTALELNDDRLLVKCKRMVHEQMIRIAKMSADLAALHQPVNIQFHANSAEIESKFAGFGQIAVDNMLYRAKSNSVSDSASTSSAPQRSPATAGSQSPGASSKMRSHQNSGTSVVGRTRHPSPASALRQPGQPSAAGSQQGPAGGPHYSSGSALTTTSMAGSQMGITYPPGGNGGSRMAYPSPHISRQQNQQAAMLRMQTPSSSMPSHPRAPASQPRQIAPQPVGGGPSVNPAVMSQMLTAGPPTSVMVGPASGNPAYRAMISPPLPPGHISPAGLYPMNAPSQYPYGHPSGTPHQPNQPRPPYHPSQYPQQMMHYRQPYPYPYPPNSTTADAAAAQLRAQQMHHHQQQQMHHLHQQRNAGQSSRGGPGAPQELQIVDRVSPHQQQHVSSTNRMSPFAAPGSAGGSPSPSSVGYPNSNQTTSYPPHLNYSSNNLSREIRPPMPPEMSRRPHFSNSASGMPNLHHSGVGGQPNNSGGMRSGNVMLPPPLTVRPNMAGSMQHGANQAGSYRSGSAMAAEDDDIKVVGIARRVAEQDGSLNQPAIQIQSVQSLAKEFDEKRPESANVATAASSNVNVSNCDTDSVPEKQECRSKSTNSSEQGALHVPSKLAYNGRTLSDSDLSGSQVPHLRESGHHNRSFPTAGRRSPSAARNDLAEADSAIDRLTRALEEAGSGRSSAAPAGSEKPDLNNIYGDKGNLDLNGHTTSQQESTPDGITGADSGGSKDSRQTLTSPDGEQRPRLVVKLKIPHEKTPRAPPPTPAVKFHKSGHKFPPAADKNMSGHNEPAVGGRQTALQRSLSDNEDYCAACHNGGEELLCCDGCPKVFHPLCHIPAVSEVPEGEWYCLFCEHNRNPELFKAGGSPQLPGVLSGEDKRFSELVLLKIYCHERSLPFQHAVDETRDNAPSYYEIVQHPMDLGQIRERLAGGRYAGAAGFVQDMNQVFINCATYNDEGCEIWNVCRQIAQAYSNEVRLLLPFYASLVKTLPDVPTEIAPHVSQTSDNDVKPTADQLAAVMGQPTLSGSSKSTSERNPNYDPSAPFGRSADASLVNHESEGAFSGVPESDAGDASCGASSAAGTSTAYSDQYNSEIGGHHNRSISSDYSASATSFGTNSASSSMVPPNSISPGFSTFTEDSGLFDDWINGDQWTAHTGSEDQGTLLSQDESSLAAGDPSLTLMQHPPTSSGSDSTVVGDVMVSSGSPVIDAQDQQQQSRIESLHADGATTDGDSHGIANMVDPLSSKPYEDEGSPLNDDHRQSSSTSATSGGGYPGTVDATAYSRFFSNQYSFDEPASVMPAELLMGDLFSPDPPVPDLPSAISDPQQEIEKIPHLNETDNAHSSNRDYSELTSENPSCLSAGNETENSAETELGDKNSAGHTGGTAADSAINSIGGSYENSSLDCFISSSEGGDYSSRISEANSSAIISQSISSPMHNAHNGLDISGEQILTGVASPPFTPMCTSKDAITCVATVAVASSLSEYREQPRSLDNLGDQDEAHLDTVNPGEPTGATSSVPDASGQTQEPDHHSDDNRNVGDSFASPPTVGDQQNLNGDYGDNTISLKIKPNEAERAGVPEDSRELAADPDDIGDKAVSDTSDLNSDGVLPSGVEIGNSEMFSNSDQGIDAPLAKRRKLED